MNLRASILAISLPVTCVCMQTEARLVKGRAVAIHWFQVPMNGVVTTDFLLQIVPVGDEPPEIVRVSISIPAQEFNAWLAKLPEIRQFSIVRNPSSDSVLNESVPVIEERPGQPSVESSSPLWKPIKGSEGPPLPIGKKIKAYRSSTWPLQPVL